MKITEEVWTDFQYRLTQVGILVIILLGRFTIRRKAKTVTSSLSYDGELVFVFFPSIKIKGVIT
ncbi:hypothetical protein [Lacticaseibacillus manihotivorans]|uniref:hypothetical protein n=1 Tax=Lacticaseibacillus manihotivorans TaxID=88233 RepID=UPI0006CFCC39|nr:hypothetical protein [Lacticaseibacillus manihotivorans]